MDTTAVSPPKVRISSSSLGQGRGVGTGRPSRLLPSRSTSSTARTWLRQRRPGKSTPSSSNRSRFSRRTVWMYVVPVLMAPMWRNTRRVVTATLVPLPVVTRWHTV